MADRLWRAQITTALDSGIPEDSVVNTLYFDDDDDPLAGPEDTAGWIFDMVETFMNAAGGAVYGSNVGSGRVVRLYDMADPEPRVPIFTQGQAVASSAETSFPNEVAVCASFSAAIGSGDIPARKRGRIYLGPVKQSVGVMVGSQLRIDPDVQSAIVDAMETMAAGFLHPASPGFRLRWATYSPTIHAASTVGAAFNDVVSGWVDDAFDTQRRRGGDPTSRTTFGP